MALSTAKVEFCQQELSVSNASAVWTDVSDSCKGLEWWGGKQGDLDTPSAGGCTLILDNTDRRWEPDYSLGSYYPNIKPLRRFRITITADAVDYQQGIYYAQSWGVTYGELVTASDVAVTCVDGFGILSLALQASLEPPSASTYADVVAADNPVAHFPLDETGGSKFSGDPGPEGQIKVGAIGWGATNPVVGESQGAAFFTGSPRVYGRALADDKDVFKDAGQFTLECVATVTAGGTTLVAFGFVTGLATFQIELENGGVFATTASTAGGGASTGTHHFCGRWDGGALQFYVDGVHVGTDGFTSALDNSDANEYFYIHGGHGFGVNDTTVSHAAFYDYALSAAQIANHATAALNRGYAADTTGNRVAALAVNALWSTAGITGGDIVSVAARMQTGQSTLEEINQTVTAEQPFGMFWFNDAGNPSYLGGDYDTTIAATMSDSGSDTEYIEVTPVYDDELYNSIAISRDGGDAQTRSDSTSQSAYGVRGYNQTGLIVKTDSDAGLVAAGVQTVFANPFLRFDEVQLDGLTANGRLHALQRDIGDVVRVKVRTDTGEPIDVLTRILGKKKSWTPEGNLYCTWNLARGFDASLSVWHLSQVGYSELNTTTILA